MGRESRVHHASDLLAFKANFRQAKLAKGLLPVLAFSGGYGGMVRADGDLITLACCIRRDRLEAMRRKSPGLSAGEVIEALLKEQCGGVKAALQGATREGAWLAAGPLDTGIHLSPGDGMFRIGNAAGEAHPIIGEGMSMALQSAWLLCAQLLHAKPGQDLADPAWQREQMRSYAAQWRSAFAAAAALCRRAARMWRCGPCWPNPCWRCCSAGPDCSPWGRVGVARPAAPPTRPPLPSRTHSVTPT